MSAAADAAESASADIHIAVGKPVSGENLLTSAIISAGTSLLGSASTAAIGGFKSAEQLGKFAKFMSYPPNHPAGILSAIADTTQSAQAPALTEVG